MLFRLFSRLRMPVSTMDTKASGSLSIDLSLHRITELLRRLSSPQARFPIIHVAGTNSKGSTIAYLSSILNNTVGVSTGTFTSPHLRLERDCCKIGGQVIDASIWEEAGRRVAEADAAVPSTSSTAPSPSSPSSSSSTLTWPLHSSPFELITARSFLAFSLLPPSQRPEILLVEVGMGGALDATNVFTASQVLASVICPIDYDHQAFLGDTLAEIASQKSGIIKSGGLCIMADQRRQGSDTGDQVDCTKVKRSSEEAISIDGREAAEIQDTIRQKCASLNARLVKAYVPWQALTTESSSAAHSPSSPWSTHVATNVRYTPNLQLSRIHAGDYVSSAGDPVVPGPVLHLPKTRAALTGCHLALQTLWSIARDETPCALGEPGSDASEELRLRIAYSLREDRVAKMQLESTIQATRILGRADWIDVELRGTEPDTMQIDGAGGIDHTGSNTATSLDQISHTMHALVDGAHNKSAALALQKYVKGCVQQRIKSSKQEAASAISQVTLTWILAFSQGKDISGIMAALFGGAGDDVNGLTTSLESLSDVHVEHRVACVPFTTPVEGMPWVTSYPAEEIATALQDHSTSIADVQTFSTLPDALTRAAKSGDGKTVRNNQTSMIVIAGSLYLVSDVYRLLAPL
jgi:folylpolyglutamate synthase/dihydropteroate synthase